MFSFFKKYLKIRISLLKMYRQFVNSYLTHAEMIDKFKEAPKGTRYCNFVCQDFLPLENFDTHMNGYCKKCRNILVKAKDQIKNNQITLEQFKENPDIINNKPIIKLEKEIECVRCKKNKSISDFDPNRNICRECRNEQEKERSIREFDKVINDIETLKGNLDELKKYLDKTRVTTIRMILEKYNIGRKSTDKKSDSITRIVKYFEQLQHPKKCLGNCGTDLQDEFSYCEKCKKKPKKISVPEKNLEFKENLDNFMEELYEIQENEVYTYNASQIYSIAEYLDINITHKKGHTKQYFVDLINEKLKPKRDERHKLQQLSKLKEPELSYNGFNISTREDGFISATEMCKIKNKKFNDWHKTESTKDLIKTLEEDLYEQNTKSNIFDLVSNTHISNEIKVVDIKKGGNNSGTWIHPDLAVQLAQWLDKKFAIRVSRFIREYTATGQILKKVKTDKELLELEKEHKKLQKKHNSLLSKRSYYKFNKGPVFYIISDLESNKIKYKIGIDNIDINVRLAQHRTTMPSAKLEYLLYTDKCGLIEQIMLTRFESKRYYNNHEWIYDVNINELIKSVKGIIDFAGIKCLEEDNLSEYNEQIEIIEEDEE
jgi:hypothetical protein